MKNILFLCLTILIFSGCSKPTTSTPTPAVVTDPRDQFVGRWKVDSSYVSGTYHGITNEYDSITKSSSHKDQIIIAGWSQGWDFKVYAILNGNDFTIPSQYPQSNFQVSGGGTFKGSNVVNYTYTWNTINGQSVGSETGVKQ